MSTSTITARDPRGGGTAGTAIDRSTETIARVLEDAAHFPGGKAEGVARPRSEADIAAILAQGSTVLVVGAQSSLTGGATPHGGLVMSTEGLNGISDAGP